MTRDEVSTLAKNLLFENVSTTAIGTPEEINQIIDAANRKVWLDAVQQAPSVFEVRSGDLNYSASTGYLDVSTIEGNSVHKISRVYVKAIWFLSSVQDPWMPLEIVDGNERFVMGHGVWGGPFIPRGGYLEGERLYTIPKMTSDQTLQIVYVPTPVDLQAGDQVLNGVSALKPYHSLVAYEAAMSLSVKDEASIAGIKLLRDEMKRLMLNHLSSRQRQRGRTIREVPFA